MKEQVRIGLYWQIGLGHRVSRSRIMQRTDGSPLAYLTPAIEYTPSPESVRLLFVSDKTASDSLCLVVLVSQSFISMLASKARLRAFFITRQFNHTAADALIYLNLAKPNAHAPRAPPPFLCKRTQHKCRRDATVERRRHRVVSPSLSSWLLLCTLPCINTRSVCTDWMDINDSAAGTTPCRSSLVSAQRVHSYYV